MCQDTLWAKRDENGGWHSLVDHSADVAAVLETLLQLPLIGARLHQTAGAEPVPNTKLAALAFLHDIGKANRGFQARSNPDAPRVGHIDELAWVFAGSREVEPVCTSLVEVLGLERIAAWLPPDDPGLFDAVFAHHGRPWRLRRPGNGESDLRNSSAYWRKANDDPIVHLAPMRAAMDRWFREAFEDGSVLPGTPAFQHGFAGLLMLADWLGSNPAEAFFPFAYGREPNRMAFAQERAATVLRMIGLDAGRFRDGERRVQATFASAFRRQGQQPFEARPIQRETARAGANVVVLESETGSGKTEAALWRFAELFRAGAADGLYFALPTRVAATQIFERVKRFRDRVFPADDRPPVVLAVPGQMRVDEAEGRALPDFDVQWSDDGDGSSRWAAAHPKRFLTAPIAVGTIDQALLGAIRVKHAHLRAVSLLNKLLVVDEVHASDTYMERLLVNLLRFHAGAGGHALLLSATLGAGARARLLGAAEVPGQDEAAALAYPALSWLEDGRERRLPIASTAGEKSVALDPRPLMAEPAAIAALALDAARAGAKVLVIRNTVGQALRTQEALEASTTEIDGPLLFRVPHPDGRPVATLHHSRFAEPDRRLLDAAVERAVGRERAGGGLVLVGTQTLEQSLDIDADLLITDLCPIDVLLQRIGRLHRHTRQDRPAGYEAPRTIVLMPLAQELFRKELVGFGLGSGETGGVYEDLRIIELTRRLVESEPMWTIPEMNRRLVEVATHPDALADIEAELSAADPGWRANFDRLAGRYFADLAIAHQNRLRFDKPFTDFRIEPEETIATRLGGADRHVAFDAAEQPLPVGPFGLSVSSVKLPHHMARDVPPDATPALDRSSEGGFSFRLGPAVLTYDRLGLRRMS